MNSAMRACALGMLMVLSSTLGNAETVEVLHTFDSSDAIPVGALVMDVGGRLFGTTSYGGYNNYSGTLFEYDNGVFKTIHEFAGGPNDGGGPGLDLVERDGVISGALGGGGINGCGALYTWSEPAQYAVTYDFKCGAEGFGPNSAPTLGDDGFLYGTTGAGGASKCDGGTGCGIVYRLDPISKSLTVLKIFHPQEGEGADPRAAPLIVGNMLYGTTYAFRARANFGSPFSMTLTGDGFRTFAVPDGLKGFVGGLSPDSRGNLWGFSMLGGHGNHGTLYKIDAQGEMSVEFEFGRVGAQWPQGHPIVGGDGTIYGTAWGGRATSYGIVWKFDPSRRHFEVLHNFTLDECEDPVGTMVPDRHEGFFGLCGWGGANGVGTLWHLTK